MVGLLTAAAGHELKKIAVELQHEVGRERHIREARVDGVQDIAIQLDHHGIS
jgi:hypothetical protein